MQLLLFRNIKPRAAKRHMPCKKVKQSHHKPWRRLGGEEVYSSYWFLTSAFDGGEWPASRTGRPLLPVPII
jgi:hypothetical protein